jgi:hypothetical protein
MLNQLGGPFRDLLMKKGGEKVSHTPHALRLLLLTDTCNTLLLLLLHSLIF